MRWMRRLPYARTALNQLLYVPGLSRLASYDVVHVFSASYASFLLAPVPAMLAARLFNKRVVLHYHSGEAEDHLAHWGALVHPWLKLADEIVVPSAYLRDVFAKFGYRARVIPNVVDLTVFDYRERRPLRPRLLSTRNLEQYYRVDVIIEAFARFQKTCPDCDADDCRIWQRRAAAARDGRAIDDTAACGFSAKWRPNGCRSSTPIRIST